GSRALGYVASPVGLSSPVPSFLLTRYVEHRDFHSFPTRRSSDLLFRFLQQAGGVPDAEMFRTFNMGIGMIVVCDARYQSEVLAIDRKSTRLNSSHVKSSYAVFCLKKKTNQTRARDSRSDLHVHDI